MASPCYTVAARAVCGQSVLYSGGKGCLWPVRVIQWRQGLFVASPCYTVAARAVCGQSVLYSGGKGCLWPVRVIQWRQGLFEGRVCGKVVFFPNLPCYLQLNSSLLEQVS